MILAMRYMVYIIYTVIAIASIASCSKNKMNAVIFGDGVLSDGSFEIPPTGGSFSISFTSDRDWTITWLPSWIKADNVHGGEGTTVITFEAGCNTDRRSYNSTIVISAEDGSFSKEISVKQEYPYLYATIDETFNKYFYYNESFANAASPFEIFIESNIRWAVHEIKDDESYDLSRFKLSSFDGEKSDTLSVLPENNNFGSGPYIAAFMLVPVMQDPDSDKEDAVITVPEKAADRYTVYLSQDNFLFLLNGSPDEYQAEFSELDNRFSSVDVEIEAESPWTVASAPDWVVMNYESGQNLTLSISPDGVSPTSSRRSGTIVLRADAEELVEREIGVSQEGYLFELSGIQNLKFVCDDTTKHVVTLRTTGAWEILNIPDWLEVNPVLCEETTPESGVVDHGIHVRMKDENLSFEPVTADIVFSRTEKPYNVIDDPMDISETVVQEAFVFELEPSPVLSRIPTFNTQAFPVNVRCSGDWEIETVSDWIDISKLSGEKGEESIMVNAKTANPDMEQDRVAQIEFVSLKHKALGMEAVRSIEIRQRQYVFEIETHELENIPAYKTTFPGYMASLLCSAEWELTDCPDWLIPSVSSGDGMEDVDIMFTPEYNASFTQRSGIIRLKDNYMNKEISVTARQEAFEFDASDCTYPDVPVMNQEAYRLTFDMTAEAPWTMISCPNWIEPSLREGRSSASGVVSVSLVPEPNPDLSRRSGTVVLESTLNGVQKSIRFEQEPYEFDDSRIDLHFTELSDEREMVTVLCSGPWVIDAPSWVNLTQSSGSTSQTVYVSVDKNTKIQPREASFTLLSTLNGLTREFNIKQDPYEFDSESESFRFEALDNEDEEFEVLSSGRWRVENVPSWISLSETRGNGSEDGDEERVTFSVSDNLTESERSAVMYVKSEDNAILMKNISVQQDKFVLEVSVSSCAFSADDSSRELVSVTCSGDWTASTAASWVNITNVTSSSFRISVDENVEDSKRGATVIVRNPESGISRTINVVQAGAE